MEIEKYQDLTPKTVVSILNRSIVGQEDAKKAVAIAIRNRIRRMLVSDEMLQEEIMPNNILMIGPTGCGKTEIARRLATIIDAPFIKVEATKFTEVGYVGRDVESIIRDLVDHAILMFKKNHAKKVKDLAITNVENRILDVIVGKSSSKETRDIFYKRLKDNEFDEDEIEIEVLEVKSSGFSTIDIPGFSGGGQMGLLNIADILGKSMGDKPMKKVKMKVADARKNLINEESDKLIDEESIIKNAIIAVENQGIVFIDEIDKISSRSDQRGEVSREGVQRDLLPLIEGTTVSTKHGPVKTDHVLFIGSGAFHLSRPSDLLPELQGRFPIRVELKALTEQDMVRILTEPEASLIRKYTELLKTENIILEFKNDGIERIAEFATNINENIENIGARRLHTLMEKLIEDVSFNIDEYQGKVVVIDAEYVKKHLEDATKADDLSKFIL